jgi:alpha-ribazole phosphatase
MTPEARLWLIRHAQPLVDPGICYGATDLGADGPQTAQSAARLAPQLPTGAVLRMSGLRRAQELAWALWRIRPDLARPQADPRLNEMDFGAWEMKPWDVIARQAFDDWIADFAHHRFGGRESVGELLQRVDEALKAARHQVAAGIDVVWVTHAGVIRAVQHQLNRSGELPTADAWPREAPEFGGCLTLTLN